MDSYLRQFQLPFYQNNPTIIQSSTIFHPNYQILAEKNNEQVSNEELRDKLRKQLEYYFSRENIINDVYLQSQMDADNYVPISLIANFKLIKRLTQDLQLIINVLKESSLVEVDNEEKKVRSLDSKTYLPTRKRCIIILRNIPFDATENEILDLFINKYCPVSAIGCERVLESNHSDCWYVTFNSEDDAQNAFLYFTRENISIRGQKILARMKASLWQKTSLPEQHTQSIPLNNTISNQPQQYYYHHQPTFPQQTNMNFHQQTQLFNRNHPVFPTHFWYIPSPTTDSYSPMIIPINSLIRTYNGPILSKTRIIASKPRISTKSISNHDKLSQNNTSHSEDKN